MTPSACHLATQLRREGVSRDQKTVPTVLGLPFGVVPTASPADWNCHLPASCLSIMVFCLFIYLDLVLSFAPLDSTELQCLYIWTLFPWTSAQTYESSYIFSNPPFLVHSLTSVETLCLYGWLVGWLCCCFFRTGFLCM